jgi:hypothetical protein
MTYISSDWSKLLSDIALYPIPPKDVELCSSPSSGFYQPLLLNMSMDAEANKIRVADVPRIPLCLLVLVLK